MVVLTIKKALIFAHASTALSIGARQVSDSLAADTGVTNSTAVLDLSIALAAAQPVPSLEDGQASWDDPEGAVAAPVTLVALNSAQINATIESGALNDITTTNPKKRGLGLFERDAAPAPKGCIIGPTPYSTADNGQTFYQNDNYILYDPVPQYGSYGLVNDGGLDLQAAISDPSYITFKTLTSSKDSTTPSGPYKSIKNYIGACSKFCDQTKDCKSFNLYYEFDNPSYDPQSVAAYSNNPTFAVRCAAYRAPFKTTKDLRKNPGQWTGNCVTPQTTDSRPFAGSPQTSPVPAGAVEHPRFIKDAISVVYSNSVINCPAGYESKGSPTDNLPARYNGANNPIDSSQDNILSLMITDTYSAEDCAAKCNANPKCGFFNVFSVSPGANPNQGLQYFGPDVPQLPIGTNVPNGIVTSSACHLFRKTEPVETRTSYGQFHGDGFSYVVNSLSCAKPNNQVDSAPPPQCVPSETQSCTQNA